VPLVRVGKNSVTNAIKSLPSLLTVNPTDNDVERRPLETLRADWQVC
jgi:hypothetical protein